MTRVWRRLEGRRQRIREGGDAGFTMLEMVVGMTLMTIFLGIFTSSIIQMFDSTNKAQSVNNSSAQLNVAFGKLDKTIRYASYISAPATGTDGNWYVTFQTTNTGAAVCTQLRIAGQQLQQRTWAVTGTPPTTSATQLTAWVPLASSITNGGAASNSPDKPFTFTAASPTMTSEQLNLRLLSADGSGNSATTSVSSVTFVAMNTSQLTQATGLCGEVTSP